MAHADFGALVASTLPRELGIDPAALRGVRALFIRHAFQNTSFLCLEL